MASIHVDTNTSIDLFNRPGRTFANALGYGIDFNGNYSLNDADSGNLWATEEALPTNGGDYFPTSAGSSALTCPLCLHLTVNYR